jgi:hypothetical protein
MAGRHKPPNQSNAGTFRLHTPFIWQKHTRLSRGFEWENVAHRSQSCAKQQHTEMTTEAIGERNETTRCVGRSYCITIGVSQLRRQVYRLGWLCGTQPQDYKLTNYLGADFSVPIRSRSFDTIRQLWHMPRWILLNSTLCMQRTATFRSLDNSCHMENRIPRGRYGHKAGLTPACDLFEQVMHAAMHVVMQQVMHVHKATQQRH